MVSTSSTTIIFDPMKFGYLPPDELHGLDLSLPPDSPFTTETFKKLPKKVEFKAVVGCAKWNIPQWIDRIYPKGSKSGDFLQLYSRRFNSVELNTMYYGLKDSKDLINWNNNTPNDFIFCPKFLQVISHDRQLKDVDQLTEEFIEHFEPIRSKLGHYLLQLENTFSPKQQDDLLKFLLQWASQIPLSVELRHPDWFNSEETHPIFQEFKQLGVSAVITDSVGRRDCVHQTLTSDTAFIRFNGSNLHPSCFQRLDDWAIRIKDWKKKGLKNLFFFIHNEEEVYSPQLVGYFIEQLNDSCGLNLQIPKLYPEQTSLF